MPLLLCIVLCFTRISSGYELPKISLARLSEILLSGNPTDLEVLNDDAGKISAFIVSGTGYNESDVGMFRKKAVECIGGNEDLPEIELDDGSTRRTFATLDSVFPYCMGKSVKPVTNGFDNVERVITGMIELKLRKKVSYTNGSGVVGLEDSPKKDHIHVYKRGVSNTDNTDMVPYHIDNGVFLIVTPFPGHGLLLKTSKGTEVRTDNLDPSVVLVLMCRGLTEWALQRYGDAPFYAVPHAVSSFAEGSGIKFRSIYARMKVVAMEALPVIEGMTLPRGALPFKSIFENTDSNGICSVKNIENPPQERRSSWLRMMDKQCENGEAFCWMSCRPFRPSCSTVEDSICYNKKANLTCGTKINGLPMDAGCRWECKSEILGIPPPPANDYCTGKMDMLMTGFALQGRSGDEPCIILFIEAWTLDSRWKFAAGCIGAFFIGIAIEAVISFRRNTSSRTPRFFPAISRKVRKAVLIVSFGVNLALGYLAMLIAMTYSIELFFSVIFGLILGHAYFNLKAGVSESIDPCCAGPVKGSNYCRDTNGDTYPFTRASCEESMPSILNRDNQTSVPCCGNDDESVLGSTVSVRS